MDVRFTPKYRRFEVIIGLIFLLTLLTGALRKWVFGNGIISNTILVFQLCIPYLLFFSGKKYKKPWEYNFIIVYLMLLILLALNPMNLTYFHGALGLILHFNFWFTFGYYILNRNNINLRPLIPIFLICSFIEIVLGFIQYQLPPEHWLNAYANIDAVGGNIALVGDSVRVIGTFSFIGGFTAYLSFLIFFVWYLLRINYNPFLISILYSGGLVASFMSGARTAVGVFIIVSFIMIFSEFSIKSISLFLKNLILPLVFFFSIFLLKGNIGIEEKISKAYDNFTDRVIENSQSGEQKHRLTWDLEDLYNFRGKYPFFGIGLGSTYQGATSAFGTSIYLKEYGYYENELTRIAIEGGFVLLIFRFLLVAFFVNLLMINTISKIVIFLLIFYFTPVVFNIYNSIFFMIGLILIDNASINDLTKRKVV